MVQVGSTIYHISKQDWKDLLKMERQRGIPQPQRSFNREYYAARPDLAQRELVAWRTGKN